MMVTRVNRVADEPDSAKQCDLQTRLGLAAPTGAYRKIGYVIRVLNLFHRGV
jgi:hypothetical protein